MTAHVGRTALPEQVDPALRALLRRTPLVDPGGACYTSVKWLDRLELTAQPGEHAAQRIAGARLERARSARSQV